MGPRWGPDRCLLETPKYLQNLLKYNYTRCITELPKSHQQTWAVMENAKSELMTIV